MEIFRIFLRNEVKNFSYQEFIKKDEIILNTDLIMVSLYDIIRREAENNVSKTCQISLLISSQAVASSL